MWMWKYMVKDDEGHGFRKEENRFDFYGAMESFLDEHIGSGQARAGFRTKRSTPKADPEHQPNVLRKAVPRGRLPPFQQESPAYLGRPNEQLETLAVPPGQDRSHQRFNDAVKDRWPWMSVWLYHRPRSRFLHYRFERALLAGREFQVADRPSILFFTTHKAASMFVDRVLKRLGQAHGMLHADLEGWFSTGPPKLWVFKDPAAMKQLFRPRGIYYGALRSPSSHCGPGELPGGADVARST